MAQNLIAETALSRAKKIIARRANDPKAKMFGLSDDLLAIGAALEEFQQTVDHITASLVLVSCNRSLVWANYQDIGPQTRAAIRAVTHRQNCACEECMRDLLNRSQL